jgi:hypothetical protein
MKRCKHYVPQTIPLYRGTLTRYGAIRRTVPFGSTTVPTSTYRVQPGYY